MKQQNMRKEHKMPARDKTGPFGTGPMGRGRGGCQQPGPFSSFMRGMGGRCFGNGRGRGFGFGRGFFGSSRYGQYPVSLEDEAGMLEKQISLMQSRLDELKKTTNAE
jgi:hypothetical protein